MLKKAAYMGLSINKLHITGHGIFLQLEVVQLRWYTSLSSVTADVIETMKFLTVVKFTSQKSYS